MSFPLNPYNGQVAVKNGIKYVYTLSTNSWRRDFNNALDRFFLVGGNQAINTNTGDLVVFGGVGIWKNLQVGGNLFVYGTSTFIGVINGEISTATTTKNIAGGNIGSLLYQSNTSTSSFIPIDTTGTILMSDGVRPIWTATVAIGVAYATTATNIAGGLANQIPFQSNNSSTTFSSNFIYDTASLIIKNTTPSTSTITGALQVAGGVGIVGDVFIGGNLQTNGTKTFINTTELNVTDKNITISKGSPSAGASNGAGLTVEGPSFPATILYSSYRDSWNFNKLIQGTTLDLTAGIESSSINSGTFTVSGGIGATGNIYASAVIASLTGTIGAGTKYSGEFTTLSATSTTESTNATTGAVTVTGGVGITKNLNVGTTSSSLTLIVSSSLSSTSPTTGAAVVTGGVGISGDIRLGGTMYGIATTASYAVTSALATLATSSTNISNGLANQIPFQSGPSTTSFSTNLTFDGRKLTTSQLVISTSTTDLLPDAVYGIELKNTGTNQSPAIRLAGNSSGIVLVSSFGALKIMQDATTLTNTLLNIGITTVSIPVVTSSVNTGTGSLVVAGGVGIGGDVYVGGDILPSTDIKQDLGSLTKRWKSLYVSSSTIYIGDYGLGIQGGQIVVTQVGTSSTTGTFVFDLQNVVSDITPKISYTGGITGQNIGSTTATWKSLYVGNVYASSIRDIATGQSLSNGYTGSPGALGGAGFQGSVGNVGFRGSSGYFGSGGAMGPTGYQGSGGTGFTGSIGPIGVGLQGSQGILGYTGSAGIGIIGTSGVMGYTGSAGIGLVGSRGLAGYTGSSAINLSSISTSILPITGIAYSLGNPTQLWEGVWTAQVFTNFIQLANYTTSTSGNLMSPDGIRLEWNGVDIASGSNGYTGSSGSSGTRGYTGSAGIGNQGSQGILGYTGSAGIGIIGTSGVMGYTGSAGPQGPAGTGTNVTGYTGSAGIGSQGSQGILGYTGSAGTGNGISGINVLDEGSFVGTFTNINFIGASIVASTQSPGYAAITLSGSGYTGSSGTIGFLSSRGYTGSTGVGVTGSFGYTGSLGIMGYIGSSGSLAIQVGMGPASSTSFGVAGTIIVTTATNTAYLCITTNTWVQWTIQTSW